MTQENERSLLYSEHPPLQGGDDGSSEQYEVLLDSVSFAVSERVKLLLTVFTTAGLLAIIVELQSHYGM